MPENREHLGRRTRRGLSDDRIEEIRARARKATPGPLVLECDDLTGRPHYILPKDGCESVPCSCCGDTFGSLVTTDFHAYGPTVQDAELFAHAQSDITALLEEIDRLRLNRVADVTTLSAAQMNENVRRNLEALQRPLAAHNFQDRAGRLIVDAVLNKNPMRLEHPDRWVEGDDCVWCGAHRAAPGPDDILPGPVNHAENCVWILAGGTPEMQRALDERDVR